MGVAMFVGREGPRGVPRQPGHMHVSRKAHTGHGKFLLQMGLDDRQDRACGGEPR